MSTPQPIRKSHWQTTGLKACGSLPSFWTVDGKIWFPQDSFCRPNHERNLVAADFWHLIFCLLILFNRICDFQAYIMTPAASHRVGAALSTYLPYQHLFSPESWLSHPPSPLLPSPLFSSHVRSLPPAPESALKFAYGAALITPYSSRWWLTLARASASFCSSSALCSPHCSARRHSGSALPLVTQQYDNGGLCLPNWRAPKMQPPNQPVATFVDGVESSDVWCRQLFMWSDTE